MKRLAVALILLVTVVTAGCVDAGKRDKKEQAPGTCSNFGHRAGKTIAKLFAGQRVGLITNQTGVDSKLRSSEDILHGKN